MADVVNLRTVRKQRKRAEARRDATTPTVEKAELERVRAEAALERRRLDGLRRDEDGEG